MVKMDNIQDRLRQEIQQWKDNQATAAATFLPETVNGRDYMLRQLAKLKFMSFHYGQSLGRSNEIYATLQVQIADYEKRMGLNPLQRMYYHWQFRQAYKKEALNAGIRNREVQDNFQQHMERAGFGHLTSRYSQDASRQPSRQFAYCSQINAAERADTVVYIKDGQLTGFDITVVNHEQNTKRKQHFDLAEYPGVTASSATSLLRGRAVEDPGGSGDWLKLDFTDKMPDGNYRMQRFDGGEYERRLDFQVNDLSFESSFRQKNPPGKLIALLREKGEADAVLQVGVAKVRVTIYASPDIDRITVRNEKGETINPRTLKAEAKAKPAVKQSANKRAKVRRTRMGV